MNPSANHHLKRTSPHTHTLTQSIGVGRLPNAQGQPVLAAFDPEGLVFVACARIQGQGPNRHVLKLFDSKQFG